MKSKFAFSVLYLFLFSIGAIAQQGPAGAGGEASGSGGTVSFSIGQTDYKAIDTLTGKVNQGLQQPYEIQILTGVEQQDIQLFCSMYPNPASDYLVLQVSSKDALKLHVQIIDLNGKQCSDQLLSGSETRLSLSGLPNASYLIRILNQDTVLKVYKIIKNQ